MHNYNTCCFIIFPMEFSTVVQLLLCAKLPLTLVVSKFDYLINAHAISTARSFTSNC